MKTSFRRCGAPMFLGLAFVVGGGFQVAAAQDSRTELDQVPVVQQPTATAAQEMNHDVQPGAATVSAARPDERAPLAAGESRVRIVRLSDVRGAVKLDRRTRQGFEPSIQNMPIVEGMRLATEGGSAEVEFEDDSTVRATPDTLIEFPRLVLEASGGTV